MNTNFKVIGLTRLEIKSKSTAPEADALTTRPSELLYCYIVQPVGQKIEISKICAISSCNDVIV